MKRSTRKTPLVIGRRSGCACGGFTLIEVLATMVLMGVLVPVSMRALSIALANASHAKHLSEATMLAESKLNELIVDSTWQSGNSNGDFPDRPDYKWQFETTDWPDFGATQLVVTVQWNERGRDRNVQMATIVSGLNEQAVQDAASGVVQ